MSRSAIIVAAAVLGVIATCPTASEATALAVVQGDVLVNHGNGFQPASGYVELFPGDTVMARDNAVSRITYSDNCVQTIEPGSTVTVTELSPCATQATGALPPPGEALTSVNYTHYILGAAVVGGAIAAIAASGGGGGGGKPASP
jgi:hypothetical protein